MNQLNNKLKFLVIRFSSIGDIVLTSPLVRCLKQQVEGAEIYFLTKKEYFPVLKSNPYIFKVYEYPGTPGKFISHVADTQFDYIIDLQNNRLSKIIKLRLKLPAFTVNKLNILKFIYTRLKINLLPQLHIVDRYMDTVSLFDVENDLKGLDFFICGDRECKLPPACNDGYIAFVIGGTYFTKKLPAEKVAAICRSIDFPVVLIGGNREREAGEIIMAGSKGNVFNYVGKGTINESAILVRDARLVLTNDTGFMHIAAAFKKKILSFWGNTVPQFGMYPYMADPVSTMVEVNNLKCRPCSKLGYQKCPRRHFRCMNDIDLSVAVDWIYKNF
ncbi:MAG: glycosyltransferase family 9 protein [Bacteroidales bacterium]|nr:glycosyltransferase family 9 protein [Bacteroidales bacterium]